jgi:cell division protein FtsW
MNRASLLPRLIGALTILMALLGVTMVYSSSAFQISRARSAIEADQLSTSALSENFNRTGTFQIPSFAALPQSRFGRYSTAYYFWKQLAWVALGTVALVGASLVDYPKWQKWGRPIVIGSIVFLLLVWSPVGKTSHGATSWINCRFFTVQPAEFAKVGLVIFLADLLSRRQEAIRASLWRSVTLFILPLATVGLVILQPDLGMATLMMGLLGGMWFLGGARLRHLAVVATLGAVLLTVAYFNSDNARRRINTYLYPEQASEASRYQLLQSQIAMANGGLLGVGLGEGSQKMHFLPRPHTDFIFAVLAEELGFVSVIAILLAYVALICAGLYVGLRTPDLFGSLLASGMALMLALGVTINLAVVSGMIPTTGLPLPFISYGGSSLVSAMWGMGIVLNVSKNIGGVQRG